MLGEHEAAWGELEEGEDLPWSSQNPSIHSTERGREESLQQAGRKAGEQQEKGVSLEAEGIPEGEAAHLPRAGGQSGERESVAGFATRRCG